MYVCCKWCAWYKRDTEGVIQVYHSSWGNQGWPAIPKTLQHHGWPGCLGVVLHSVGGADCRWGRIGSDHGNTLCHFYVDDAYLALRDPAFLQWAMDVLVDIFKFVGLATNTKEMQAMVCMPSKIWIQLLAKSFRQMWCGYMMAKEWEARAVLAESAGNQCKQAPLDATWQMSMRSTRWQWYPRSSWNNKQA